MSRRVQSVRAPVCKQEVDFACRRDSEHATSSDVHGQNRSRRDAYTLSPIEEYVYIWDGVEILTAKFCLFSATAAVAETPKKSIHMHTINGILWAGIPA